MKLGIGTYTLTWSIGVPGYDAPAEPLTAIGLLELAHRNGLSLVQFADNLPLHVMDDLQLTDIYNKANELGIELEVGTRGSEPALLRSYLTIAKRFGSRIVRTLITTPDLTLAKEQLLEVLPEYRDAGIALAIENHGMHTTRQLSELFDAIGDSTIGCCLDTVNSFSALDSPGEVVRDLAPYVLNLHIKDFDITRVDHQMGFSVLGTPAGHGRLGIPEIVSHIQKLGREATAILELWTPYAGSVEETVRVEREWMRLSLEYLRECAGLTGIE